MNHPSLPAILVALLVVVPGCGGSSAPSADPRTRSTVGAFAESYLPGALDLFEQANVSLEKPTSPPPLPIVGAPAGLARPETTIVARGATEITVTAADAARPQLQCGATGETQVLCAQPGSLTPGRYLTGWFELQGNLPLTDEALTYQYALVFDRPGVPNYEPTKYPLDFFFGTDRWFEITKVPGRPFEAKVLDAKGGALTPAASGARMIVQGRLVLLMVLLLELGGAGPVGFRATAHAHEGDYGAKKPWSGATSPNVGEPLALVSTFCAGTARCEHLGDVVTLTMTFAGGVCTAKTSTGSTLSLGANGTVSSGGSPAGTFTTASGVLASLAVGGVDSTCTKGP